MSGHKGMGFIDFSDMDDLDLGYSSKGKGQRVFIPQGKRCHETHPDLPIGIGTLIGGNCRNHDRHKDVALYVALDYSMEHPKFLPEMSITDAPRCVYYPIENMKIPRHADNFAELVKLIRRYLDLGQRVHVGCIGGHGRTGLVIAAVASHYFEGDCIAWTRNNYCDRAIESKAQENFLVVHYGATKPPQKYVNTVDKRK